MTHPALIEGSSVFPIPHYTANFPSLMAVLASIPHLQKSGRVKACIFLKEGGVLDIFLKICVTKRTMQGLKKFLKQNWSKIFLDIISY